MPENSIYHYIGNHICVSLEPLIAKGIATVFLWKKWKRDNPNAVIQRGGNGRVSLLSLNGLPDKYRKLIVSEFGNPETAPHPMEPYFQMDADARVFYEAYTFEDGTHLTKEQITRYTINASVLNCIDDFKKGRAGVRRSSNHSARGVWKTIVEDVVSFSEILKRQYGTCHTIKATRLHQKLSQYKREGYITLVDGRNRNKAAAKIEVDEDRMALLEQLLRKHSNFNNEQVRSLYNTTAVRLGWPSIHADTVANYRARHGLYLESGNRGLTHFRTQRSMQVKRSAPSVAMAYWSIDGWDAELLYQKFEDGRTTYHHRLTVVVVLDPVGGLKYPIGYAIGTHETPELIREALRNAVNHTRELFGERYKTLQLQSDRYGNGKLTPIYEAVSGVYTPAAVKNAKAKIVERYFLHLNKMCQMYFPNNWSGHNMDANRNNQPNEDFLNKIRHSFPDEAGVRSQIETIIGMERSSKEEAYLDFWEKLPETDRKPMSTAEYLYVFGETHTHTNRIQGNGFTPTIMGHEFSFDTFDTRFRELAYLDWAVKYDPADMETVLVMDARCDNNRRVQEIVGNHRFELSATHVQPMALYDRKDGDAAELSKVKVFNKQLEESVVVRSRKNGALVDGMFVRNPELNETLTKLVLTDSTGQHKDQRNLPKSKAKNKQPAAAKALPPSDEKYEIVVEDVRSMYGNGI